MLQRRQFLRFARSRYLPFDGYWLHVNRPVMACRFEVTMPRSHTGGITVAQEALDLAGRIEEQLTVFREASEVSYINRNAASRPIRVEDSLWQLLGRCRDLHRESNGAFDITSAPLSRCWGFLRRQGRVPDSNEIDKALSVVGCDKVHLDDQARTIRFQLPGVELNFGSIGKGYALDQMARAIHGRVETALLSAGSSSLLGIGAVDLREGGWKVGIRHPSHKDRRIAVLRLRDCAMSTSGTEEQFFEYQGKRYGHIIDPGTGQPAEGVASATVVAASAELTDALATAFYVGGVELAERYCASRTGVMAIILENGATQPVILGGNQNCNVELTSE